MSERARKKRSWYAGTPRRIVVALMCHDMGLSYEEIASALDTPVKNAVALVWHGKQLDKKEAETGSQISERKVDYAKLRRWLSVHGVDVHKLDAELRRVA